MLPGISGFHWQLGHMVFISTFFTVILVILGTSGLGFLRSAVRLKSRDRETILWEHQFHGLPPEEKACRHAMTGELKGRVCPNAFDCRECATHEEQIRRTKNIVAKPVEVAGMSYSSERLYHRGHTWVGDQGDGTAVIGLDDFASRLIGEPDQISMPIAGQRLTVNGSAWTARKSGAEVRILAPISGEVLEVQNQDRKWSVRVKPDSPLTEARHLLRGPEVGAWIQHELERLQALASSPEVGAVLADGGELVDDLSSAFPSGDWDHVCSSLFLQA